MHQVSFYSRWLTPSVAPCQLSKSTFEISFLSTIYGLLGIGRLGSSIGSGWLLP